MWRSLGRWLFAITFALGCSDDAVEIAASTRTIRAAVQGGARDDTSNFAVAICFGGQGDCAAICSGTLIAPRIVLSARHCFDAASPTPIDCTVSTFGETTRAPTSAWVTTDPDLKLATSWRQARSVITPHATAFCGHDLALLVLDEPFAISRSATPAASLAEIDHDGARVTAIGFGKTGPDEGAGERRVRAVDVECFPGASAIDCRGRLRSDRELLASDGLCEGDSGSGAFVMGDTTKVLGVFSRGGVSSDGTRCEHAIYTRLDVWMPWLTETARTVAETAGEAPPAWAISNVRTPSVNAGDASVQEGVAAADAPRGSGGCAIGDGDRPTLTSLIVLAGVYASRRRRSRRHA